MPRIKLDKFAGQLPAINPYRLPNNHATIALNAKLWSASIKPLRQVTFVQTTVYNEPETIFRYDADHWFEFQLYHDVTRSPSINDQYGRVYFTGPSVTGMRVADATMVGATPPYPGASVLVGVPVPTVAPTCVVSGTGSGQEETRFYVYTAVNAWGEESAPSPVSLSVVVVEGEVVTVTFTAVPAGSYHTITLYRIYRTNNDGSSYQFVGETASSPFVDPTYKLTFGQEELPSAEWDPPPTDIEGLIVMPNGVMVGFRRNEVMFSEPGLPFAWPVRYRVPLEYTVVKLGLVENGVGVLTNGQPYLISGSHPSSMVSARLNVPFQCTAPRGAAQLGNTVIWPCPRGLALIDSSGARIISDLVFDDDDWREFRLTEFMSFNWRGLYIAFFQRNNEERGGFLLNPNQVEAGIVTFDSVEVFAGYESLANGKLYLVIGDNIVDFDEGENLTYIYRSKPFEMARPVCMSAAQVMAEQYPIMLVVYRDGEMQDRLVIGENMPRRIAGGMLGRVYEVEVISRYEIREIALASTMKELATA